MAVSIERSTQNSSPTYYMNAYGDNWHTRWDFADYVVPSNVGCVLSFISACGKASSSQGARKLYDGYTGDGYYSFTENREAYVDQAYGPAAHIHSLRPSVYKTYNFYSMFQESNAVAMGTVFLVSLRGVDTRAADIILSEIETIGTADTSASLAKTKDITASTTLALLSIRTSSIASVVATSPNTQIIMSSYTQDGSDYLTSVLFMAPGNVTPISVVWNPSGMYAFSSVTVKGKNISGQAFMAG